MENFNIISNNCVGARYYEKKSFFPNPFMWNSIKLKDFIFLIENFDNINLSNIKSYFTSNEIHKDKENDKCSTILLDGCVKLYYIHHHYEKSHSSKKVFRNNKSKKNYKNKKFESVEYDVSGYDILDYLEKCWFRRLSRFDRKKKKIFVYWDSDEYTNDDVKKLFEMKGDFIIIVLSKNDYSNLADDSHIYLHMDFNNTIYMAGVLDKFLINF
jgi:hypothetical protein